MIYLFLKKSCSSYYWVGIRLNLKYSCKVATEMALAFQDVLNDAKKLTNRLNEHDSTADALVSQMQAVYQQVEAMKQVGI